MPRLNQHPLDQAVLLDVRDVAALLGCSGRTVLRHPDAGLMPLGLKIGSLRRWKKSEIQAWIDGGCRPVRQVGRT